MALDISERNFETVIEAALLTGGPDEVAEVDAVAEPVPAYGDYVPGGYRKRSPDDYDRDLCLDVGMVVAFVKATQPREWAALSEHHGPQVEERFARRLSSEIDKRGALDVLRRGIKDSGVKVVMAYFRPASGLNPEIQTLYEANMFSVVRQLRYSTRNENSLDLVLFLNGIPIFTAELKNPLNAQNVQDAIQQYRRDRDPRELLLRFGQCLAHFAVDPEEVHVTTKLERDKTRFLPFNKGKFGGAGNPPDIHGFATRYLWEHVWARDSVLELIDRFIHLVIEEDNKGRKTGEKSLIFPRYHQLDAVRRLVGHARQSGTGQHYLIQHSAGSGKSNSIAWLGHQLSVLHDAEDRRVFDSMVVITDRRVLDRQLQRTVRQFERTLGVVENIDKTSRQLREALEEGKTIIVTTLQKFPVIVKEIGALPGKRFAVIIDEAHSSQSGEATRDMKRVLAATDLDEAEEEEEAEEDLEDRILAEVKARGRLPNVSLFAFTATPKPKTLEMFGTRTPDGSFEAFSLYSMRQAIEEGFIMDVLENYTTYKTYWKLLKTIADDPHYARDKASYLLRQFVELHPHAINEKVAIMAEHFAGQTAHRIGGRAKAMIVTRSRLHAVRTKLALDRYLKDQGHPYKALVAFSGTVKDGGVEHTEANMNHFPESQTATVFKQQDMRFLVVAEKFQTGFDEPLLHTMYVDKKLSGVNAVQTLSRLNRVYPGKSETIVLDFVNDAGDIQTAFQPYYEKTILSEETDPNLLYDLQRRLEEFEVFDDADVDAFARVFFGGERGQDALYDALAGPQDRFAELSTEGQVAFKRELGRYVRLYRFLSQIMSFADADLEQLYVFAQYLYRTLETEPARLPVEVRQAVDIESFRIEEAGRQRVELDRGRADLQPMTGGKQRRAPTEEVEPLSRIIRELNDRFGADFDDDDRVFIAELEGRIDESPALEASVRANTPDNARLTFDQVATDLLQDMVETNFDLYKRITDDDRFGKYLLDRLFERYRERIEETPPGPRPPSIVDKALEILISEARPRKVILFGSAARGDADPESDLDFLVVLDEIDNRHSEKVRLSRALAPLRVPIDVLIYSEQEVEEWGHVVNHVINEALLDGRTLYEAA
jgi:type I restriction enzyme, R subunit